MLPVPSSWGYILGHCKFSCWVNRYGGHEIVENILFQLWSSIQYAVVGRSANKTALSNYSFFRWCHLPPGTIHLCMYYDLHVHVLCCKCTGETKRKSKLHKVDRLRQLGFDAARIALINMCMRVLFRYMYNRLVLVQSISHSDYVLW